MHKDAVGIVFSDMDATFLATDKRVPHRNMDALDMLARHGIPFVPCTGRPASAVPPELLAHPATRYVVGSNGAVVVDVVRDERLHVEPLDRQRVLDLYERVRDLRITFDVFADGNVWAERERYEAMGSFGIDEPSLAVLRRVRQPVDLSVPHMLEQAGSVEKITCFWCTEDDRDALGQAVRAVGGFSNTSGHPKNFELQAQGVNKATGARWLCAFLDIPLSNAVAFGDEDNDIPLLAAVGDGVAMGNANARTRAVADHVTARNDEAGVARYLERLLG